MNGNHNGAEAKAISRPIIGEDPIDQVGIVTTLVHSTDYSQTTIDDRHQQEDARV